MMADFLEKYTAGKGVDTSLKKHSSARHVKRRYDNLYSLYPVVKFESCDYVTNVDSINATKFGPVILSELIKYVKTGGFLLVSYTPNKIMNSGGLRKIAEKFIGRFGEVAEYRKEKGRTTMIFRKTKDYLSKGDSINKWTIGVITNGKRDNWVLGMIESVRKQRIPEYEILIVGNTGSAVREQKGVRFVYFDQKDEKGWITRKKNVICEKAKYENVLVLHDHLFLDKNWYSGMKRYGNYFQILTFWINSAAERVLSWDVASRGRWPYSLDARDWDASAVIGGSYCALKKDVALAVRWDERLFHFEGEDFKFSLDATKKGFVSRVNVFSDMGSYRALRKGPYAYKFDPAKLGRLNIKEKVTYRRLLDTSIYMGARNFSNSTLKVWKYGLKVKKRVSRR